MYVHSMTYWSQTKWLSTDNMKHTYIKQFELQSLNYCNRDVNLQTKTSVLNVICYCEIVVHCFHVFAQPSYKVCKYKSL